MNLRCGRDCGGSCADEHTHRSRRRAQAGGGFLGAIESGSGALLLEGESGIGKTTLWNRGLAESAARGQRVLRCQPSERETQLAYTALAICSPTCPRQPCPACQSHNGVRSRVALLRAEPDGEQSLQRAVGLGLLGVLRALAEQTPTLLAIHDYSGSTARPRARWRSSRDACRSSGSACSASAAAVGPDTPLELDRAFPHGRFARFTLGDLDAGSSSSCSAPISARVFRAATLERGHRVAGAISSSHLDRQALAERSEQLEPAEELPIPANLRELVRDRLELLPPAARAACRSRPRFPVRR